MGYRSTVPYVKLMRIFFKLLNVKETTNVSLPVVIDYELSLSQRTYI